MAAQRPVVAKELVGRGPGQSDVPRQGDLAAAHAEQQKAIEALAEAEAAADAASKPASCLPCSTASPTKPDPARRDRTGPPHRSRFRPSAAAQARSSWVTSSVRADAGIRSPKDDTVAKLREQLAEKANAETTRRLNKLLIARVFPDRSARPASTCSSLYSWKPVKVRFQVLNAQEAFMIWMKAALMTGLVIASPYLFFQIWIFVAAGLYPHEKNYVYLYLPISLLLFFGGASLAFVFVFDPVLDFLFTFNKGMNADFDPRIGEWLGFVLILPLGFGISFQLPLVMLFLNRIGLVSIETYIKQWRIAILTIFVVAMVLTPADPISMLLMAGAALPAVCAGHRDVQVHAQGPQPVRRGVRAVSGCSFV